MRGLPTLVTGALALSACKTNTASQHQAHLAASAETCPEPCNWDQLEGTPAKLADYTLDLVAADGIEQAMVAGSDAQQLPKSVQGIFWMDGNPLGAGEVFSFAKIQWDFAHHKALDLSYGENNYTFPGDAAGKQKFERTLALNTAYEFTFNDDYTWARLEMTVLWNGIFVRLPSWLVDFTMHVDGSGNWVRESTIAGQRLGDYTLRRIVDDQKHRLPAYDDYKKVAPSMVYLPRRIKS